ncbi:hypothetical protein JZK55_19330 [Dissulfurispira thermophila]|uniref:Uncharacterized protein n=1 Tax=Dissulfurispira thermophila TaxID=2715679 RepID=A0A7G1H4E3_9BACT|nr:hypothetical protein [Dissulfurispira thermophila]BCB97011.1 hypothetical protein JZK55_19330 [Dissulfurispira thermophila]
MCIAYEMRCQCGSKTASFHFKDNIMTEHVIKTLYCPNCSSDINVNPEKMIVDNGWVIEYDMDIAKFMGQKISNAHITPDILFDEGYCTWNGIYPGDHIDSLKEREGITALAKTNPLMYLNKMKSWAKERTERLKNEGWRKAKIGSKS